MSRPVRGGSSMVITAEKARLCRRAQFRLDTTIMVFPVSPPKQVKTLGYLIAHEKSIFA